MIKGFIRS